MYSQNGEDKIVEELFNNNLPGYVGTLISIGENDGVTLSNSRLFVENGWKALLVEPSKTCFVKLSDLYRDNSDITLANLCIGNSNTVATFHESASLLSSSDHGLVSTLCESEVRKWSKATSFTSYIVDVVTVDRLLENHKIERVDYISIDAEGMDLEIFRQFDLTALDCKVVVVEWNGKNKQMFDEIATKNRLHLRHKNAENLIYSIWQ